MADIGLNVSIKGQSAKTNDPKSLSWTSALYQHSIAKTGFVQTSGFEETISHALPFIPIVIGYTEQATANQYRPTITGSSSQKIYITYLSGARVRYYAFYQAM